MGWGLGAAAQQRVESRNELPPVVLRGGTLRQVVHLSVGGDEVRVRLSNRFGKAPLEIEAVRIARSLDPATARIDVKTEKAVTFSGAGAVTIPAGGEYVSDAVRFEDEAQADVAITLYMEDQPAEQTGHPGSRATSYVVRGNHVSDADFDAPAENRPLVFYFWHRRGNAGASGCDCGARRFDHRRARGYDERQ